MKAIPEIDITLDKPRKLVFSFRALMVFEKATGKKALSPEVWTEPSATDLVTMLWAGLLTDDPGLTVEQVADMLHPGDLDSVFAALGKALDTSQPEVVSGDPLAESRPTG